jgi:hypothetical protein
MSVIMTAKFRDLSIRAVASYDVATERARELLRLGWDVELNDEAGNPVVW